MTQILCWTDYAPNSEAWHAASYMLQNERQAGFHCHDFAEVFWVRTGSGSHLGPTETHSLKAGHLCWVSPPVTHSFASADEMELVNISFPADLFAICQPMLPSGVLSQGAELPPLIPLAGRGEHQLHRALHELVSSPRTAPSLFRFLSRVLCAMEEAGDRLPPDAPDWLDQACRDIRRHEHSQHGVSRFVELCGRSPEHVSRSTRTWCGIPPRELVQAARLEWMARELAMTGTPIQEIALEAGFENLGHSYSLFRKQFGMPPGEYRKKQKGLPEGIRL